jgi:hypothetical protein
MSSDTKLKPASLDRLFSDLDKPTLHGLSYVLRHPEMWPEGFYWDYEDCCHCAIGLSDELWSDAVPCTGDGDQPVSDMAKAFAMPYTEAERIFFWANRELPRKFGLFERKRQDVTPDFVADQIDAYLARAE